VIPAKWYVGIMVAYGVMALLIGAIDRSKNELLQSLAAFGIAAFAYLFYIRRWKR
jgi:hypothetical protein